MPVDLAEAFSRKAFYPLGVREVRRETRDAVSIRLDVPRHLSETFAFRPGQYLTVRAEIDGEEIRRNYSICAAPHENELRVAIKRVPGGRFSTFAATVVKSGDVIEVMPAMGRFTAPFDAARQCHYVAFAAGSGITPILSILKTALRTEPRSRFTLLYGNRHSRDILFLEELAALKNRYMARVEIFHFLTGEEDDFELFHGRLDAARCECILQNLVQPELVETFFLCGPEAMMHDVETALLARGVPPAKILLERFLAASAAPVRAEIAAITVQEAAGRPISVVMDGRRLTVMFDAALGNILDTVRAAGIAAPYACKGGVCCTCRARRLRGDVTMKVNYGLTAEEVAQGYILTCQATPLGDDLVISYDV